MKGRKNEHKILVLLKKKKQGTKANSGQTCRKMRLQINGFFLIFKLSTLGLENNWQRYNTTYEAFYQSIKGRRNKPNLV